MTSRLLLLLGSAVFACAAQRPGPPAAPPQGDPATRPAPLPPLQGSGKVAIAWNRFYDAHEIDGHLRAIAAAHPELCTVESIGKSTQGRDLLVLTIHDKRKGPDRDKPALWVDGNVHGNEVQGAEACVYLAWYLTENHGKNPKVTELLERAVFYVLPMQNPDGRAHWFAEPNTPSSSRSGLAPTDNDGDGLFDEDGPDDLDGDGEILQMRKYVPGKGDYRADPDDPRRMIRVAPGKTGDYVLLGLEGIDNDGDGLINEDGPGGYDLNRNWPSDWQPNHIQFGAGDYPLSHPEPRAIADFILARPNIGAMQSFHNNGGMILRGPGASYVPEYPQKDLTVFDDLGLKGEAMLPFYRYMVIHRDLYTVHGGFVNWGFEGLGAYAITNELWNAEQMFQNQDPRRGPAFGSGASAAGRGRGRTADDDAQLQDDFAFDQLLLTGASFVPWHRVPHPTYGEVELGGFRKLTGRVPPSFMIEEMLHRNALFCVYQAEQLPEVVFEEVKVEVTAPGVSTVSATLYNRRRMPTRSGIAAGKGMGLPDLLSISGGAIRVAAGGIATDRFRTQEVSLVKYEPGRLRLEDGVPGFGRLTARWIVQGSGPVKIRFEGERASPIEATAELP